MNIPVYEPQVSRVSMTPGYRELQGRHDDRSPAEAVWSYLSVARGHHLVLPDGRADLILRFTWAGTRPPPHRPE